MFERKIVKVGGRIWRSGKTVFTAASAVVSVSLVWAGPSVAQEWVGGAGADWTAPTSWNNGAAPISTTNVTISSGDAGLVSQSGAVARDVRINGTPDAASLTVTGAGRLDASGTLLVGNANVGSLSVLSGGVATFAGSANLGGSLGSSGNVFIDGANSALNLNNFVSARVGQSGTSIVDVRNGGQLNAGGILVLGETATGVGTVRVSGAGSRFTQTNSAAPGAQMEIGLNGRGTV